MGVYTSLYSARHDAIEKFEVAPYALNVFLEDFMATTLKHRSLALGLALCTIVCLGSFEVAIGAENFPSLPGRTRSERWIFVQRNMRKIIGAAVDALKKLLGKDLELLPNRTLPNVKSASFLLSKDSKTKECEMLSFVFYNDKVAKIEIMLGEFVEVH